MPTPQFVLDLRASIGRHPLPLPSVTAVVLDDAQRVLLVRRADNDRWALVTGCLEPGEQPAAGALREVEEETGVLVETERIVSVAALPLATAVPLATPVPLATTLSLTTAFSRRGQHAQLDCRGDGCGPVGHSELAERPQQVRLHSRFTDVQRPADVRVRAAAGNQREHLGLAR